MQQGVVALTADVVLEIIEVERPDHPASVPLRLEPVHLWHGYDTLHMHATVRHGNDTAVCPQYRGRAAADRTSLVMFWEGDVSFSANCRRNWRAQGTVSIL